MAEIPRVEQQNGINVLRDKKLQLIATKKRLDESIALLRHAKDLIKQNQFFERGIDGARGQIFILMIAQLRNAEVAHSDEYLTQIAQGLEVLAEEEKKAEKAREGEGKK